jgi:hypothetical protein
VLPGFVWLVQISGDAVLTAKMADVADADYTPKSNGQKVVKVAAEAAGRPDSIVKPGAPGVRLEDLVGRALAAVFSPTNSMMTPGLAGRVQIGAEVVYVRGVLDNYEVHICGGAIYRQSDGRRVYVASAAAGQVAMPGLDAGGVMGLVQNVLILAEDERNAAVWTTTAV